MSDAKDMLRDERLVAVARGDDVLTAQEVGDVVAELLRARRLARADGRRAMQVRRLRWQAEAITIRLETMLERMPASDIDGVKVVLERLCDQVDALERSVRALPLELEPCRG